MDRDEVIKSLEALGDLDNLNAMRVQVDALKLELLEMEALHPGIRYRVSENGPEQTIPEILAEWEREEAGLQAIRNALAVERAKRGKKGGDHGF